MQKEIGGEFWNVPTSEKKNDIFPEFTQWFLSGRSALKAVIENLGKARNVAIPSWCCDSMVKPFLDAGMNIHFYPVFYDGKLIRKIDKNCDVLFLIDYFGYTEPQNDLQGYKGTIIRDVTHSLFSNDYDDADYFFGSLRKWCGIWTGGYAWTREDRKMVANESDNYEYVRLRERAMQLKSRYIHGSGKNDKGYLKIFNDAEVRLDKAGISKAADRDIRLAQRIDVDEIRKQRRLNADVLRKAFPEWTIFSEMCSTDCPMFVPILVPDGRRNELRDFLIKNEIYCPIHWPVSKYHKLDEKTGYIYQNELSLVCDQRYTEEDMNRMVETIRVFMED